MELQQILDNNTIWGLEATKIKNNFDKINLFCNAIETTLDLQEQSIQTVSTSLQQGYQQGDAAAGQALTNAISTLTNYINGENNSIRNSITQLETWTSLGLQNLASTVNTSFQNIANSLDQYNTTVAVLRQDVDYILGQTATIVPHANALLDQVTIMKNNITIIEAFVMQARNEVVQLVSLVESYLVDIGNDKAEIIAAKNIAVNAAQSSETSANESAEARDISIQAGSISVGAKDEAVSSAASALASKLRSQEILTVDIPRLLGTFFNTSVYALGERAYSESATVLRKLWFTQDTIETLNASNIFPRLLVLPSIYKGNRLYGVIPSEGGGDFIVDRLGTTGTTMTSLRKYRPTYEHECRFKFSNPAQPLFLVEYQSTNILQYPRSYYDNYWIKSGVKVEGEYGLGQNLVVNGDFAVDASWIKSNSSIANNMAILSGASSQASIQQNGVHSDGIFYRTEVVIDMGTATSLRVYLAATSSAYTSNYFVITQSGTYVFYYKWANSDYIRFVVPSGAGSCFIHSVNTQTAVGFECPMENVIEETYTEGLLVKEDQSNGNHRMYSQTLSFSNLEYTASVFLKYGGRANVAISIANVSSSPPIENRKIVVNILTGTVVTDTQYEATAKIEKVFDDWYRVSFKMQNPGISTTNQFNLALLNDSLQTSYMGDGTSGVYIWHSQIESGTLTSPIYGDEGGLQSRNSDLTIIAGWIEDSTALFTDENDNVTTVNNFNELTSAPFGAWKSITIL